ncbi:MAG: acetoacetate decarboxylase family protein [Salinibacterium sp.]|nr:acetoacetate decarboxylase family protein [Salinibacterium sp.]
MTAYPSEPWHLAGSLLVSVFLVPPDALPVIVIPDGRRPLRWGRRVIVGAAFVHYVPPGVLEYDEFLVAVPSFGRGGLRVTITQIWVDSAASVAGGRELWGIPKQLAQFGRTQTLADVATRSVTSSGDTATASMTLPPASTPVASIEARYGRALFPGMPRLPLPTLQALDGRRILSHNRVIGRIGALRAAWTFDPAGQLGYLSGRRPFLSIAIRHAAIIFGMNVQRA